MGFIERSMQKTNKTLNRERPLISITFFNIRTYLQDKKRPLPFGKGRFVSPC